MNPFVFHYVHFCELDSLSPLYRDTPGAETIVRGRPAH